MDEIDVLLKAVSCGIVDFTTVRDAVKLKERDDYLKLHDGKIYTLGDGYFATRIEGKLIRRKNKEDIEDIVIEYVKQHQENKIYDVFMEWIDNKLYYNEIQKQTYDRYISDFNRFIKNSRIDRGINNIYPELLERYIRDTIKDNQLTAKAWSKLRLILIGIFKWAKKNKYTDLNIVTFFNELELSPKIFKHRRFTDEESVFTDDEARRITRFIDLIEPNVTNFGIVLAFQTGLRVGELSSLKWEDIKDGYISVYKTEIRYTDEKGHQVFEIRENAKTDAGDRYVILTDEAKHTIERIREINANDEYIFTRDGVRIRGRMFTNKLRRICGYLGITPKSMHKARKTYATKLMDAGVAPNLIIRQMGHTNISTTDTFYYFNTKTLLQNKEILESALCS